MIGAVGAHALGPILELNKSNATFETASRYHFYHGIALLVFGSLTIFSGDLKFRNSIVLSFVLGILLFSGSLYCLAIFNIGWFGAITPIGGVLFMVGWALLAFTTRNLNLAKENIKHAKY